MFYENELRLLCETFKKCHVQALTASPSDPADSVIVTDLGEAAGKVIGKGATVREYVGNTEERTLYKYTDPFGLRYTYLVLPSASSRASMLFIGPYLSAPISSRQALELGESLGVSPKGQKHFEQYCQGITVIEDGSPLLIMLNTFCERIWGSPSFAIVDRAIENALPASPINEPAHSDNFDDVLMSMRAMEKRYEFENELMQAVTLGQMHKEPILLAAFSDRAFEKRVADPVRNAKNYGIIMNTLLRKAAEKGGVHPVYLDRISSQFAHRIEQMTSLSENTELMCDIFRAYCRLVRKHSMKNFSKAVQKTVLVIDSDLAADLSLSSLAANQGISAGYLSAIFKKETGKTVSEYIREKRMKHAAHLLGTTRLQIQTVALHCGIVDVQYFSKLFKRHTGMTPKEYREANKK